MLKKEFNSEIIEGSVHGVIPLLHKVLQENEIFRQNHRKASF
jgi:hypothetical protein